MLAAGGHVREWWRPLTRECQVALACANALVTSATVERVFSMAGALQTRARNLLGTRTLRDMLTIKAEAIANQ